MPSPANRAANTVWPCVCGWYNVGGAICTACERYRQGGYIAMPTRDGQLVWDFDAGCYEPADDLAT